MKENEKKLKKYKKNEEKYCQEYNEPHFSRVIHQQHKHILTS